MAADDLPEVLRSTARLVQEGLGAASVEITTSGTRRPRPLAVGGPLDGTETPHIDPADTLGKRRLGHLAGRDAAPAPACPPGTARSSRTSAEHVTTILQTAVLRDALRATVAEAELRLG